MSVIFIVQMKMKYTIGIDEVGRGPIAGPIALGSFVFLDEKAKRIFHGVKESKQLSFKQREFWFKKIVEEKKKGNVDYAVCFASNKEIDNKGLVYCINKCLTNCLKKMTKCKPKESKIILDGGLKAPVDYLNQKTYIKGDEKFTVIALASIAAKVMRDRKMIKYSSQYPGYGFEKHVGYGTKDHIAMIKKLGISEIHRKSFMKNLIQNNKKYLVTGGEGFIGSRVSEMNGGVSFDLKNGFNILDKQKLEQYVSIDGGIFHLAAKISVPESFEKEKEYFETNVIGLKNLVEIAKEKNNKLVFSSSAAVYGNTSHKVREIDRLEPLSPYASNKLEGEKILEKSGIRAVCLRYFNVYGMGQSSAYAGVITNFVNKAKRNEDIVIYGNGEQVRDFVHVDDVARANILAMEYLEKSENGFDIFNIGSGNEMTIKELAQMIISLTKSKSKIIYKEPRLGDIIYSCADISKARKILGFKPRISLQDGLEDLIKE